ncbi:MAG: DUF2271 domain-containing protein [Spirochaetales bacterium]|nr:DUF2271 domain-containing protein [Spirochaetales bacterium]
MKKIMLLCGLLVTFFACSSPDAVEGSTEGLYVELSFNDSTYAKGVYIWVEDSNGDYIDTIRQYGGVGGSSYTSSRFYDDDCNDWQNAAGETSDLVTDGVSGATVWTSLTSETWDMTDSDGNSIAAGDYQLQVEVTYHDNNTDTADRAYNTSVSLGSISIYEEELTIEDSSGSISSASFTYVPGD